MRHYRSARAHASPPRRTTALHLTCDKAENSARQTNTQHPPKQPLSAVRVGCPDLPGVIFKPALRAHTRWIERRATGRAFA